MAAEACSVLSDVVTVKPDCCEHGIIRCFFGAFLKRVEQGPLKSFLVIIIISLIRQPGSPGSVPCQPVTFSCNLAMTTSQVVL